MGLLSGLEKFGLGSHQKIESISEKTNDADASQEKIKKNAIKPAEEKDFLIEKGFTCPVCDHKFKALAVRTTKLRRLSPDDDLRPRYENVDTVKYDTAVCPNCGYAAMGNYFSPLSQNQIKRLREQVMAKFRPWREVQKETYTYEEAIDRYQLCIVSAMVKNSKISEKSYICLKVSWLYREMAEHCDDEEKKAAYNSEYEKFYSEAYDGFTQAIMSEHPPICGMNVSTVEYLIAIMAVHFGDYKIAYRYIGGLISSKSTSARMKDRCVDLKEQIQKKMEEKCEKP